MFQIDSQGRIVLPKDWRERWGNEVLLIEFEDRIEIIPKRKPKLSQFFDIIETDVKEDIKKRFYRSCGKNEVYRFQCVSVCNDKAKEVC